ETHVGGLAGHRLREIGWDLVALAVVAFDRGGAGVDRETEERHGEQRGVDGLQRRLDLDVRVRLAVVLAVAALLHAGRDERCRVARERDHDGLADDEIGAARRGITPALVVVILAVILVVSVVAVVTLVVVVLAAVAGAERRGA